MNSMIPLYQVFDSLFPLGSYTFSGGMETYTQNGMIKDRQSLGDFLRGQGYLLPYGDIGIAAKVAQGEDFVLLDHLTAAMKGPEEIRSSSEKLCARLIKEVGRFASYPSLEDYRQAIKNLECDGHYPVAVGLLIKDLQVDIVGALELYIYSMLSVMVNHAVKLVPLGQKDGQAELFAAMAKIPEMARTAMDANVCDLGVSGCGFDLRAMQHESLHGRLFSS